MRSQRVALSGIFCKSRSRGGVRGTQRFAGLQEVTSPDSSSLVANRYHAFFNSLASMGRRRMRLPVSANMAFPTAAAIGGVAGSPTPVGWFLARHDVNFDFRSFVHGQHLVIVKIALLHPAVFQRDRAIKRRREPVDYSTLHLRLYSVRIHHPPTVNCAHHPVDMRFS